MTTEAATPATAEAVTKKPVEYQFHAFLKTNDGPVVVTAKRKTELQDRINELGVEADLIQIIKGRRVNFAERKQLTLI